MKAFSISVLLSGFLFSIFGIAAKVYGVHSTPGIWLALANFPGILVVVWLNGGTGFAVAIFVNSLLYLSAVKITHALRRISN